MRCTGEGCLRRSGRAFQSGFGERFGDRAYTFELRRGSEGFVYEAEYAFEQDHRFVHEIKTPAISFHTRHRSSTCPDSKKTASSTSQTTQCFPPPPLRISPLLWALNTAQSPLKKGSTPPAPDPHHVPMKCFIFSSLSTLAVSLRNVAREGGVSDPDGYVEDMSA